MSVDGRAQKGWARKPANERTGYLRRIATKVRDNAERLARIITAEQAKVLGLDMEVMRQEIFGPVLPIQIIDDLDEAIALANDCEYGLTSYIYTRDMTAAMRVCNEIDFGETYINRENFEAMQGFHAGVRKSGIGGADGKHGVYEFTHANVVYIQI